MTEVYNNNITSYYHHHYYYFVSFSYRKEPKTIAIEAIHQKKKSITKVIIVSNKQ